MPSQASDLEYITRQEHARFSMISSDISGLSYLQDAALKEKKDEIRFLRTKRDQSQVVRRFDARHSYVLNVAFSRMQGRCSGRMTPWRPSVVLGANVFDLATDRLPGAPAPGRRT